MAVIPNSICKARIRPLIVSHEEPDDAYREIPDDAADFLPGID
ncbi:hypothetical protein [uncultured Gardnerella sp.]|nr:hypothetical protein [uncultured Gardnerella sp.]